MRQRELLVGPRVTVPLAPRLRLALGPLLKYSHTAGDPGTVFATTGPHYGAGHFGELGAGAALDYDTRDHPLAPARGTRLRLAGQWYPALWDAVGAFGRLSAEAATHVSLGEPSTATLALRLGGLTTSGTTPFHEAAYVGGATTIRGYAEQRFSGRSGAYANAELRLLVGRPTVGDLVKKYLFKNPHLKEPLQERDMSAGFRSVYPVYFSPRRSFGGGHQPGGVDTD